MLPALAMRLAHKFFHIAGNIHENYKFGSSAVRDYHMYEILADFDFGVASVPNIIDS